MANNKFSCKNCKDRRVGCHGKCEKYLKEKDTYEKQKESLNTDKELGGYYSRRKDKWIRIKDSRRKHHQSCG